MENIRLVLYKQLRENFGITYTRFHLKRLEKKGAFPPRLYLSHGRAAWVESEVQAWLSEKLKERTHSIGTRNITAAKKEI